MKRISTMFYCFSQGIINIFRNKLFSLASVGTITACLFLLGIFTSVVVNIQSVVDEAQEQVSISVFFEKGITEQKRLKIGEAIEDRMEVSTCTYISPEEAWAIFSEEFKDEDPELIAGFEDDNPLINSASYEIHLNDITKHDEFVRFVTALDGVRKVNSSSSTASGMSNLNTLVGYASMAVILVLLCVSIFLISNTVNTGISVRKNAIGIMKLIGATDAFIRAPFVIEGLLIGIVGSVIPIGLVYIVYDKMIEYIEARFHMISYLIHFLPTRDIMEIVVPMCLFVGIGIGFIGSFATVRKHLKV
ncbi:MAG: permease-like cell division protein FtsX [Lachnospiraceae bacterium]